MSIIARIVFIIALLIDISKYFLYLYSAFNLALEKSTINPKKPWIIRNMTNIEFKFITEAICFLNTNPIISHIIANSVTKKSIDEAYSSYLS